MSFRIENKLPNDFQRIKAERFELDVLFELKGESLESIFVAVSIDNGLSTGFLAVQNY